MTEAKDWSDERKCPQAKNEGHLWKLKKARKQTVLSRVFTRKWPSQHLNFRLLTAGIA